MRSRDPHSPICHFDGAFNASSIEAARNIQALQSRLWQIWMLAVFPLFLFVYPFFFLLFVPLGSSAIFNEKEKEKKEKKEIKGRNRKISP